MRWATLDGIIRGMLIKQGKPIHWYLQYLKYGCDAIRELHFDTLRSIHTEKLTVTSYKTVILPCKYVDWVRVGTFANDKVKTLAQGGSLNRLNNFDTTTGDKIVWPSEETNRFVDWNNFYLYRNSFDQFTGGIFNHRPDQSGYKFKVLPERGEIQFDQDFPFSEIVLEYIGDGLDGDAATQVDAYAIDTIESYIMWQAALHNVRQGDNPNFRKEVYDKAHRILRARKNSMSREDILNSIRKGYSATYKN